MIREESVCTSLALFLADKRLCNPHAGPHLPLLLGQLLAQSLQSSLE